jgi:hypothetical protein
MKRSLRHAFEVVLQHAENAHCADLHHTAKQRHTSGHLCPAEYNLVKQANLVRKFLKTLQSHEEP